MPPMQPVPGCVSLVLNWAVDADTNAITRHYFSYSGGTPDAASLNSLCSDAVSVAESTFQPLSAPHVGINGARAIDLASDEAAEGAGGTPWLGTRSGGALAPGTAVVVSHTIGRRYRGGHPRSYLPLGTSTDVATAGTWTSGLTEAVDSAWGAWTGSLLTSFGAINLTNLVNISYYAGNRVVINPETGRARNVPVARATPKVDIATGHLTRALIGSQRRRNRAA